MSELVQHACHEAPIIVGCVSRFAFCIRVGARVLCRQVDRTDPQDGGRIGVGTGTQEGPSGVHCRSGYWDQRSGVQEVHPERISEVHIHGSQRIF